MNITAIHRVTEGGERNVALAIAYDRPMGRVSADAYEVSGRVITATYASHAPETGAPALNGRYIILELAHDGGEANTLPRQWVVRKRLPMACLVRQTKRLAYADGEPCSAWVRALPVEKEVDPDADGFRVQTWKDAQTGTELAYALYVPGDYDPAQPCPLVLYWHGGGEKGDNCLKNLLCTLNAVIWASPAEQRKHPCFVLAPQCPSDGDWIDPDTYETTGVFDAVCRLLFSVMDSYAVDPARVYCTGFSMGGMGAWESTKKYPGLFAATLIMAGQCNYEGLEALCDKPIWVFHGQDDDKAMPGNMDNLQTLEDAGAQVNRAVWDGSVRGEKAVALAREQIARGGNILHTLYAEGSITGGWTHEFGWRPAITNEAVRDWLFSHVNPTPSRAAHIHRVPSQSVPVRVGIDGRAICQIAAGSRHNVAVLADGRALAWGFNCTGQLGNGAHGAGASAEAPVWVNGLPPVRQAAAGNDFSLALTLDGRVYGWGSNAFGQLGQPDTQRLYLAPAQVKGLERIRAIDAGDNYALALDEDGTLWAWGTNVNGQLGIGSYQSSSRPVRVRDAQSASGLLEGVRAIEAGVRTAVAVMEDGTLRCWGDGEYGQLGKGVAMHGPGTTCPFKALDGSDPTGFMTDVSMAAEGRCFTAVLKNDGSVFTWGLNRHGELGLGDYRPEVDVNAPDFSPDFLTTVVHPKQVEDLGKVKKLAAGMNHTMALTTNGQVWTWGFNRLMSAGALGVPGPESRLSPVRVEKLEGIRDIFAGLNHCFAIGEDGTLWAWGNAANGRLGPAEARVT